MRAVGFLLLLSLLSLPAWGSDSGSGDEPEASTITSTDFASSLQQLKRLLKQAKLKTSDLRRNLQEAERRLDESERLMETLEAQFQAAQRAQERLSASLMRASDSLESSSESLQSLRAAIRRERLWWLVGLGVSVAVGVAADEIVEFIVEALRPGG